jgi:predicted phosphodiesterase
MPDTKWLLFSDVHFPAHDKRAVDLLCKVIKRWKPDVIDIVGDLDDQSCFSRFSENTPDEVINAYNKHAHIVKDFLADLRKWRPDAEIVFHTGNHDIRYESYIARNSKALDGFITPEALWGVDTQGITVHHYNAPPVHRYGDIYVHHGPYALKGAGDSARKATEEFGVSCVVGHSHRQGYIPKTYKLQNKVVRAYELGHLTDITSKEMSYDRKHDWQQGFATARIDAKGHPHLSLVGINDYSAYIEGKRFIG